MASATNSSGMRIRNEKAILSLINKEPVSRADIAKKTGLTKAAVTIITEELIRKGIVTEKKADESAKIGRTPILLGLCGDSVYFIGVNIKRTGITVGMCDLCGRVVFEESAELSIPGKALKKIGEIIKEKISSLGIPEEKIYKISVVTPGPVDTEKGIILNPPNFNSWHGVNIKEGLKNLGFEVLLGNVSSASAAAEKYFGAAKSYESFMTLLVDEGIGSGIMTDGKLFGGSCEIGHITVKYDGERCECGNAGCLEMYASIPNILKGTKYKSWSECTGAKDREVMYREAEYLSSAIVTVNNIFNLSSAVLCGEIAEDCVDFTKIVAGQTLCKMILKNDFDVIPGTVKSLTLVSCSMGIYDFLH